MVSNILRLESQKRLGLEYRPGAEPKTRLTGIAPVAQGTRSAPTPHAAAGVVATALVERKPSASVRSAATVLAERYGMVLVDKISTYIPNCERADLAWSGAWRKMYLMFLLTMGAEVGVAVGRIGVSVPGLMVVSVVMGISVAVSEQEGVSNVGTSPLHVLKQPPKVWPHSSILSTQISHHVAGSQSAGSVVMGRSVSILTLVIP